MTVNGADVASGTASLPLNLEVGDNIVSIEVAPPSRSGRTLYTIHATRGIGSKTYIKASNTDTGDTFGRSIALSGTSLAVGASGEASSASGANGNQLDNGAPRAGAVYVFSQSGTTWKQEAYLKASNPDSGDSFGWSLAHWSGLLAVGAPDEGSRSAGVNGEPSDNSLPNSGAVYLFSHASGAWAQEAYIKASIPVQNGTFGRSVAGYGDTLAVADIAGVSLFVRRDGIWSPQAYLPMPGIGVESSLALFGDTLAIGCPGDSSGPTGMDGSPDSSSATSSGAVFVYVRNGGTWTRQAYLKAFNSHNFEAFGFSVALSGETLAVGTPYESNLCDGMDQLGHWSGAVYVYQRAADVWKQQAYLKATNVHRFDRLGWTVSLDGDTLAVGALDENVPSPGSNHAGAAHLFMQKNDVWTEHATIRPSNPKPDDRFGATVAVSGLTLAVAAAADSSNAKGIDGNPQDTSTPLSGAAYVFQF